MLENLKLAMSNTFGEWKNSFNSLIEKIDSLPLPIEYGSNTTMSYLKFANGKVAMWGRIAHGKNYPCTTGWAPSAGYASKNFTLNFPIALVNENPTIIPHCIADINPDTWVLTISTSYTTYVGCYLCAISENDNNKTLNMLIIGDWK